MKRPVWTVCFGIIWVIIFIATILMHVSLGQAVPAIENLPRNLIDGFMEVFGFSHLQRLAQAMETSSETAVAKCSFVISDSTCAAAKSNPQGSLGNAVCQQQVDATSEVNAISNALSSGLAQIRKVGTDKYFGQPAMADSAAKIDTITSEIASIGSSTECCVVVPAFCTIWESAKRLEEGYNTVKAEIDKMAGGKEVTDFENYASYLSILHILPWLLTLSTTFFACMWYRNGAWCCCSNGSVKQCLTMGLCQTIFWILAFIVMIVFAGIGYAFTAFALEQPIDAFQHSPTGAQLLDHIQTEFPQFWDTVFADLEAGLLLFRTSATIFVLACLIVLFYSCGFCCCRPYGEGDDKVKDITIAAHVERPSLPAK